MSDNDMSQYTPDPKIGIGGAPTRATTFPSGAAERKEYPVASGVLDYFPDALVAVARVSFLGNQQHNPGKPLNWDRSKSGDEADAMVRHILQRGTRDDDGQRHSAKLAWRALANLQKEIEADQHERCVRPCGTSSEMITPLKSGFPWKLG
jgi:hypothetical protein